METPTTVIGVFRELPPDQFEAEINRIWNSLERVKDTVVAQVQGGELPTLTGLSMVACITGQAFGYGLFHGQPAAADILADLSFGLSPNMRELAGQR